MSFASRLMYSSSGKASPWPANNWVPSVATKVMSGALLAAFIVSTLLKNSSQSVPWMGVYSTLTFGYSLLKPGMSAARRSASEREPNSAIRKVPWRGRAGWRGRRRRRRGPGRRGGLGGRATGSAGGQE